MTYKPVYLAKNALPIVAITIYIIKPIDEAAKILREKKEIRVDIMGLDKLEDMFLFAIQGEINDTKTYSDLADRVENPFLSTKLKFLSEEEKRHRATLEEMYKVYYPGKDIVIPENIKGPKLNIIYKDDFQLTQILETAMEYEKEAEKYYLSMADELSDDLESSATLTYFAAMEATHYDLLRTEKEHIEKGNAR